MMVNESKSIRECDIYLTPTQLAKRLRCTRQHIFNLAKRGVLPSIKVGRARRFSLADIVAWEEAQKENR